MPRAYDVRLLPSGCKGCGICVRFCPAGVLEMSSEFTPRGYHPPRKKDGAVCTGCRTCELMCPDLAIFVEEAVEEAGAAGAARPSSRTNRKQRKAAPASSRTNRNVRSSRKGARK